jgi:hypothetical protein
MLVSPALATLTPAGGFSNRCTRLLPLSPAMRLLFIRRRLSSGAHVTVGQGPSDCPRPLWSSNSLHRRHLTPFCSMPTTDSLLQGGIPRRQTRRPSDQQPIGLEFSTKAFKQMPSSPQVPRRAASRSHGMSPRPRCWRAPWSVGAELRDRGLRQSTGWAQATTSVPGRPRLRRARLRLTPRARR